MNNIVRGSHLLITKPKDIPAAGACSVFVTAMINIEKPTAIEPNMIKEVVWLAKKISSNR